MARNFSTEIYGQIVTLITLSMIFISIFDLGLPIYIQREIAVNRASATEIFSRVFLLGTFMLIIYFGISALTVRLVYPDIPFAIFVIISLMMYISFLVTLTGKALSGINEYKKQLTAFLLPRIFIGILFAGGIYLYSFNENTLLLFMLAGIFLNLVLSLIYLFRNNISISFSYFSISEVKRIIAISIPLGLAVIFNFLYDKIDILLISKLRDFSEVAFYNIAYGLFKSSALFFSFLLVSGFTKVAEMNRDVSAIKGFYKEHAVIISIICMVCSAVLFIFPEFIIKLIYSDKFENSVNILRILSVGIIAMGLNNLTGVILNGMGYFKVVMYITFYALIMNVVLNIAFIPLYGITAAAVLTVITEFFIFIVEWYYLRRLLAALAIKKT